MTLVIGLTGSIATGKSTVSSMLKAKEIPVIDADDIAHQVMEPKGVAYKQVVEEFGSSILAGDGTVDRAKLGAIVFQNEFRRQALNHIVHPAVRKEMLSRRDTYIQNGVSCVVLDIPLLFESKLTYLVEKTLVVYVDKKTQLDRLITRNGLTKDEALARIHAQIPIDKKVELADNVIDNNGSIDESSEQLEQLLSFWKIK